MLVVLYVLGTLLLFTLTRRREAKETLRWSESREGELRDALASAAAPDFEPEPGAGLESAGLEDEALLGDLARGERSSRWSAEGEDGFRPLDGPSPEPSVVRSCR